MGNNACCSDSRAHEKQNQRVEVQTKSILQPAAHQELKTTEDLSQKYGVKLPELNPHVEAVLVNKKPFEAELSLLHLQTYLLNEQTYHGEVDANNLPTGLGKLYKKDGAVYIGHFALGKAEGEGLFIFTDGSYFEGEMKNNVAETSKGHFRNANIKYNGGFRNNVFHGAGVEKGDEFQFSGQFQNGSRKQGTLKWNQGDQAFVYTGQFDENGKFTGKGKLDDPFGTFEGGFKAGMKEGYGIYNFKTKIRYEGYYKNDLKSGRGSIVNSDNTIAFCGEFIDGLPHGKGFATDKKGVKHSLQWNQGVYADLL